jgi:hypothetical protein
MDWCSWIPWVSRRRRLARQRARAAAEAVQAAERQAAVRRILDGARRNDGPAWNAPTRLLPHDRPLMTPAAEYRTRRNQR